MRPLRDNVRMSGTDTHLADSMMHDDSKLVSNAAFTVRSLVAQEKLLHWPKRDTCQFLCSRGQGCTRSESKD
jgi:hypothetical protein